MDVHYLNVYRILIDRVNLFPERLHWHDHNPLSCGDHLLPGGTTLGNNKGEVYGPLVFETGQPFLNLLCKERHVSSVHTYTVLDT